MGPIRLDICDPNDDAALQHFKSVLKNLGSRTVDKVESSLGVDLWKMEIQGEELTVFSDAWSIDLEGPEPLVQRIQSLMQDRSSGGV